MTRATEMADSELRLFSHWAIITELEMSIIASGVSYGAGS